MESINWTMVWGAAATVGVLAVLTAVWLGVRALLKLQTTNQEWELARKYVQDLVLAAEKTMKTAEGREKLNTVVAKAAERFPWLQADLVRTWVEAVLQEWDNDQDLAATTSAASVVNMAHAQNLAQQQAQLAVRPAAPRAKAPAGDA